MENNSTATIEIRCKLRVAPTDIHKDWFLALEDSAPSYRRVAWWASEFNNDKEDVKMIHVLRDL